MTEEIEFKETRDISIESIISLYKANGWSSADKPEALYKVLKNSHTLISAWSGEKFVGLGNAISDGYLVVYYPHLLVLPEFQGRGIGKRIIELLKSKYNKFHQQILVADGQAIEFYTKCGFERAGKTESMWIYEGKDH